MFVGRKNELKLLNDAYRSEKDELAVLHGRRRIGKSSLFSTVNSESLGSTSRQSIF